MGTYLDDFFASINVNINILELLHTGIAIFNKEAKLMFANNAYKKMYQLDDKDCIGMDATAFFVTAPQGILEVLQTGEPNSFSSVSVTGLYGVTYRWPLRDKEGRIAGCMTENISVSPEKGKISEVQEIILELEGYNSFSTLLNPRNNTKHVNFDSIVGESPSMRLLKERGKRFARHEEPILILGENGTGKDLIAQAIHAASVRHGKNFVAVNCSAIPHELMESELFGYVAGAFTGAKSSGKKGQFEQAEGGTIFLDEIGDLPLTLQAKLLRVLENREIQKLGDPKIINVDFRLLSATNRNLEHMVAQGLFREDLYYRLNLFDLVAPPLRERLSDIPLLAYSIITHLVGEENSKKIHIDKKILSVFSVHPWRGNVRELRNVLTYGLYAMEESENVLRLDHLPERFFQKHDNDFLLYTATNTITDSEMVTPPTSNFYLSNSRNEAERKIILEALEKCGRNKSKTAKYLNIARSNLYKKMHLLGLK